MLEKFTVIEGGASPENKKLTDALEKINKILVPLEKLFAPDYTLEQMSTFSNLSIEDLCYQAERVSKALEKSISQPEGSTFTVAIQECCAVKNEINSRLGR